MTNIARHVASSHASFSVAMHIMRNTAEEERFYQMSGKKKTTHCFQNILSIIGISALSHTRKAGLRTDHPVTLNN